ncbi:hypothetical protein [Actinomadura sp. CNU-125]|uniref:hypothetical protein n=1 Tax=Actinomadura sp. CNU-125 TaxID=1904961 RepID=UPI0021CC68B7|nr:hypothetical protein [Actinomadura sp. CNU-125]
MRRLAPNPPGRLDLQEDLTRRLLAARPVYAPLARPDEAVAEALRAPVVLRSYGPTTADKQAPERAAA